MTDNDVLECQDCGQVVRHLSMAEAHWMSHFPNSYIVYCEPCGRDRQRLLELEADR